MFTYGAGLDPKFFIAILFLITGGRSHTSKKTPTIPNKYWVSLCTMFQRYLKKNSLGSYTITFNNEHSFLQMNAKTKRLFIQASPQFLDNVELPEASSNHEHRARDEAMNVWSLYLSVSFILNSYTIVGSQLRFVKDKIPFLVDYTRRNFPHLVTINLHYLLHICEMIILFGYILVVLIYCCLYLLSFVYHD
jgi:hypothetical protein